MSVTPLPTQGGVQWDRRAAASGNRGDRVIRVSAHPDRSRVTLSIWRRDECVATHQMAAEDVAQLIGLLADSLRKLADQVPAATA